MLYFIGLYIFIGVFIMLGFVYTFKRDNTAIVKADKFYLFSLCCSLVLAYPYFAIKAAKQTFSKFRKNVIDAEIIS